MLQCRCWRGWRGSVRFLSRPCPSQPSALGTVQSQRSANSPPALLLVRSFLKLWNRGDLRSLLTLRGRMEKPLQCCREGSGGRGFPPPLPAGKASHFSWLRVWDFSSRPSQCPSLGFAGSWRCLLPYKDPSAVLGSPLVLPDPQPCPAFAPWCRHPPPPRPNTFWFCSSPLAGAVLSPMGSALPALSSPGGKNLLIPSPAGLGCGHSPRISTCVGMDGAWCQEVKPGLTSWGTHHNPGPEAAEVSKEV